MLYILEIILLLFLSLLNQRRLIKNVLHMIFQFEEAAHWTLVSYSSNNTKQMSFLA